MALLEGRSCDIFGTKKNVDSVNVTIRGGAPWITSDTEAILDRTVDLSPRAPARLIKFVERGPAKPRGKQEEVAT